MKHFVSVVLFGCLLALRVGAQSTVELEVTLDRDQFVPDEPLFIGLKIANHSGRTLRLGNRPDWLTVNIESRDGRTTSQSSALPDVGVLELANAADAAKKIDIAPYFRLSRPGSYKISARVRIDEDGWKEDITTEAKPFQIFGATRLFEKEFGIPPIPGQAAQGAPEVRKYIVQQARFLNNTMQLYLRVTDAAESQVFRVEPIAPTLSNIPSEIQLDRRSNLHILNQIGRVSFGYSVFNYSGQLLTRQVHDFVDGRRPRLRFSEEGEVVVAGGVRRVTTSDVPPYQPPVVEPIEVRKTDPAEDSKPAP